MGTAKANAPILIWRGLKNPEAVFCFRLTEGDGETKKRGEATSFVPVSFPVLKQVFHSFFHCCFKAFLQDSHNLSL